MLPSGKGKYVSRRLLLFQKLASIERKNEGKKNKKMSNTAEPRDSQPQDDQLDTIDNYRFIPSGNRNVIIAIHSPPGSPLLCSEDTISDSSSDDGDGVLEARVDDDDSDFEVWVQSLPDEQREEQLKRVRQVKRGSLHGSFRVLPDKRGPRVYFDCPYKSLGCEANAQLGATFHYCKFAPRPSY